MTLCHYHTATVSNTNMVNMHNCGVADTGLHDTAYLTQEKLSMQ
jgi:hypothetical protein